VLYPLTFHPIFKERVWGGRNLERLYDKPLPPGQLIGESWEISDRPGDESVIANGPLAGRNLRWLMELHAADLLGDTQARQGRFPLLLKILDAREKLSLQVHPPAGQAASLSGEPKTEMWYVADAVPGAELFVGLKRGLKRADFEERLRDGTVADCFHRLPVRTGNAMFLPSGRVHAIGAGLVIFEIQQNSDTTYRVFDWNRVGLNGQPRELHLAESLASIDFDDFEPDLIRTEFAGDAGIKWKPLAQNPLFKVEVIEQSAGFRFSLPPGEMQIIACLNGRLSITSNNELSRLAAGGFCLVPACVQANCLAETAASWLRTEAG